MQNKAVLLACTLLMLPHLAGCRNKPNARSKTPRVSLKNAPKFDHVVIISIDTLRADHLGCYGHPFVKSPNIDAFANESLIFTQHISAAPTTLASHTSLMTGTYPHTHGVPKNGFVLGDENEMLAEILTKAGFESAGFIGAFPLDARFNFDQGFAHFDASYTMDYKPGVLDQYQRLASDVTDSAIRWLDKRGGGRDQKSKPDRLFMFVHYFDVHWPYEAPPKYRKLYGDAATRRKGSMRNIKKVQSLLQNDKNDEGQKEKALALAQALDNEYSAEITYCDEHIGRLLNELKQRGIYDNALIIITSDHGETMHEHQVYFSHGMTVYDTEVHTPLIVRFPNQTVPPQRIGRIVSNIDVAPTILHLLDLPEPSRMEGESFAGIVDGPLPSRSPVFAEATQPWWDERFHDTTGWPNQKKFQCVRTETYKYISRLPDQQFGLYALEPDPLEQNNLLDSKNKNHDAMAADLKAQLTAWNLEADPIPAYEEDSPDSKQGLEHLGYTGDSKESVDATTN